MRGRRLTFLRRLRGEGGAEVTELALVLALLVTASVLLIQQIGPLIAGWYTTFQTTISN